MRYYSDNSIAAIMPMRLIENTSWKVLAYKNNEWVNTVRSTLHVVLCLLYTY